MASPNPAPGSSPSAPQPPAGIPTLPVPISSTPRAAPPIANFSPPAVAVTLPAPQAAPPIIVQVTNPPPPPTSGASPAPFTAPTLPPPPNNPAAVPIVSPAVPPVVSTPGPPSGPSPPPPSGPSPPPPLRGPPASPPISSSPIPVVNPNPPIAPPPPFPPPGTPPVPPATSTPISPSPPPQTPSSPATSPPPLAFSPPYPSPPPGAPPLSPPPPETVSASSGVSKGVIIGAAAGGAVLLLALLALFIFCCVCAAGRREEDEEKRKRRAVGPASATLLKSGIVADGGSYPNSGASNPVVGVDSSIASGYGSNGTTGSWFAYDELAKATDNFALQNKLGEGGFGKVFKGVMPDGKVVAVKVLTLGGGQGEREFRAEVEIISRVHHRHLVTLLGYCIANAERLLVYEYVPLGSLEYNLRSRTMDWTLRMRVALGVAKGLAYLHEDCHPRIFHRDIKSSNILIDEQYEAQLADFGLAKLAPDAFTHVSTRVMGTFGYLAPEYATSGKLTDKSDVFSYGVVLLELISGRKPVDETQPPGQESLVEFARPLLVGRLEEVIDPRLNGRFEEAELKQMAEVAALCIRNSASLRPRMGQVVQMLQSSDMGFSGEGSRPGHSQLHPVAFGGTQTFDADQYSAEMRQQYGHESRQISNAGGAGEYSAEQSMASYDNSRAQSTFGSGEYSHQSGQGQQPATQGGRTSAWSRGSAEEFHPPGGMPQFSGELDYGQDRLASDRLQEGR